MKNLSKLMIFVMLLLVSSINFSEAKSCNKYNDDWEDSHRYNTMANNDGVIFILKEKGTPVYYYDDWENEDRYPTYDYRHGYSYRSSYDYYYAVEERHYRYDDDYFYYQDRPQVYYEYVDYMDTYERRECYTYPPKDKVVYVKCP